MSTKRQQTMAKLTRERTVRERRARKLEKKQAAAAERKAAAETQAMPREDVDYALGRAEVEQVGDA